MTGVERCIWAVILGTAVLWVSASGVRAWPSAESVGSYAEPPSGDAVDPVARAPGLLGVSALVAVLGAVALGTLWLARRLSRFEREPPGARGPRIALGEPLQRTRRPPEFYGDLKRRETALEDSEPAASDRRRRNVVEWRGRRQPPKRKDP
jgi:hypothetical protein